MKMRMIFDALDGAGFEYQTDAETANSAKFPKAAKRSPQIPASSGKIRQDKASASKEIEGSLPVCCVIS